MGKGQKFKKNAPSVGHSANVELMLFVF